MNVLIYFPYNLRTVEQQSVMELLVRQGHNVILLTTCERGLLHEMVNKLGVIAESTPTGKFSKFLFYFKCLQKLFTTIKKYKIDVVIAHQQIPALLAGALAKISAFKLLYVRHNSDEDYLNFPIKARFLNKAVNYLTPIKIAPSNVVKDFWISKENVQAHQIQRLNYGYNFKMYEKPVLASVLNIREQYNAQLLLISIARLVPAKRHKEMFEVVDALRKMGIDCKMICLGAGPMEQELKDCLKHMSLEEAVFLVGRKINIFDYISASDVFIHLSLTEASNSAVKEVGLCKKPVIACKNVGDFDEYIVNGENSFLVDKNYPVEQATAILYAVAESKIDKDAIGNNFYQTIIDTFEINKVSSMYKALLNT